MSNTILNSFGSISNYPRSCLANDKGTKSNDKKICIVVAGNENTCTKDTCISCICALGTWNRCISVGDACI